MKSSKKSNTKTNIKKKVRNLTNYNVDYIKEHLIEYTTIPAGTKLFRTAPNICNYASNIDKQKQLCSNTGRNGVYFSTYLFQALAMSIEYNKDVQLGEFVTTVDIPAIVGKYSFRFIHPKRHFIWNVKKDVMNLKMPQPEVLKNEELSHFNHNIFPIVNFISNNSKPVSLNINEFEKTIESNEGEVFITDDMVLKKIHLVKSYKVDVSKLKKIVEENIDNLSPHDYYMYKDAILPISCGHKITIRKHNYRSFRKTQKHKNIKYNP